MTAEDSPAGPPMVTVATTMRPDQPLEVTGREAAILRHQGLLAGDGAQEHPGTGEPMTGTEHPADGTWSPAISNAPQARAPRRAAATPEGGTK